MGFYRASQYGMQNSIGYLIKRTTLLLQPRMETLFAGQELTYSQWIVLMVLREFGGTSAADLARDICHDPGSLTRIIDELEGRGLVSRQRSEADRRVTLLALTPKGAALMEATIPHVVGLWNGLLEDFSAAEVKQLIGLLTRLLAAAGGQRAKPGPRAHKLREKLQNERVRARRNA